MLTDLWAHKYRDDPKSLEEVVDEDFDEDDVAAQLGYGPDGKKLPGADDNLPDDLEDV